MDRNSKEHVVCYIDSVCKHFKINAKKLGQLDDEAFESLVVETADMTFSEGRYNSISEYMLEMWDDEDFACAINDIKIINALTDSQRVKLKFIHAVKEVAYPLFKRSCPDLASAPFCFSNTDFSPKNVELRQFVYHSKYQHIASMLLIALGQQYMMNCDFRNAVVHNHITWPLHFLDGCQYKDKKELGDKIEEVMVMLIQVDNHLEVGKRLGLSQRGQYLYDIFDTFVCNEYFYAQVDAAKEFDQWLTDNWKGWDAEKADEQIATIEKELDNLSNKYGFDMSDEIRSVNYIVYDMLDYPIQGFKPELCDDEYWEDDPDFEDD